MAFFSAAAALAPACGRDASERAAEKVAGRSGAAIPAPSRPRALRIGIEAAAATLDPRYAGDAAGSRIAALVHCALVEPEPDGGWRPSLARAWFWPDARTVVFELRDGVRFEAGRTVTAADVAATYSAVLDASSGSPKRASLGSVASVEADGPSRVRVKLSAPDAALFEGLTLGIVPAEIASRPRGDAEVVRRGCGPYRLDEATDALVRLSARDDWHGGEVTLPAVEIRVVPDTVMRTLELRSGALDFVANALEPDAVRFLASRAPHLRVSATPYDAYQYLGMNHRHPALADLRVRRAIAHAIDREAIVRHLLQDQAEPATGLWPPHRRGYEPDVRRYPFDPARARRLLDEAGVRDPDGNGPEPRLRLRYTTSTVELRRRIAEVVASQLGDVGIAVEIRSYEWGTFFDDIARGNYDLYSLAWIGIRDPDLMRVAFHSKMMPPSGSNRGFFTSARMDAVTERARRESDAARRLALYSRAQRIAARRLPYIPMWWPKNVVVRTDRLEGFTPHPAGDWSGLARATLR